ncbi:MAG: hypothetical protein V4631_21005 [Pseudomonadota bacterium]
MSNAPARRAERAHPHQMLDDSRPHTASVHLVGYPLPHRVEPTGVVRYVAMVVVVAVLIILNLPN